MSPAPRRHILVLYYYRGPVPPRTSIDAHLFCWQRFSENDVVMVNLSLGFPAFLLRQWSFDVIIFHTLFFSMRWGLPTWEQALKTITSLRESKALKIAMPQDEFYRTDLVDDFLNDFNVDELWTCAKPSDFSKIYPRSQSRGIKTTQILTGYIDTTQRDRIGKIVTTADGKRDIDVGYRAWKAEPWLGRHGMLKLWIGQQTQKLASGLGLHTDISLEEKDVITGDDWFRFLARCKAVIGCEGGSSICDRDGSLRVALQKYRDAHPAADFDEIHAALLRDRDGEIELWALSPRHLEACMTGTIQVLVEGDYNHALIAGRHYIPVKRDLSDLNEALAKLGDEKLLNRIRTQARDEVAMSERWTYQTWVSELDQNIQATQRRRDRNNFFPHLLLRLRDYVSWQLIGLEHQINHSPLFSALKLPLKIAKGLLKRFRR